MSQQNVKFIDVTKSFLPIDPQAFPESMQGTGREDAPEARIPVAAYQGYNFLPTSYGYKSYFGTGQHLGFDALGARVDYVFTFQNETFENFLIALTESGIWIKKGSTGGAWVQVVAYTVPVNPQQHFAWSYCIISDELFCYQAGRSSYTRIKSLASGAGYTVTSEVPTFLNMAGQVGIFRAGGRLGFWDSADSVSWSSLDSFADFTPSIETLAGNAIFSDVNGRIVVIRPHGEGFMIYASKSIVYIAQNTAATFQWDPRVVLSNSGIAYPDECCVAQPDTVHFAYTNTGLFKIDKAQGEVIIPEVTDFLKEASGPVYPKVLEGRYLFLQVLDPNYLNGLVQFSDEIVPPVDYVFPGGQTISGAVDAVTIRGDNICSTISALDNGDFDEQQNGMPAVLDKKPGTKGKPIWKCYISNNAVLNPADLTFGQTPCPVLDPNGVPINLCPIGDSGRLDAMTQNSTKKQALNGSDVYVDGIWTIERFIAVQSAIWDKQKEQQKAMIDRILNRSGQGSKITEVASCDVLAPVRAECGLGRYVTQYSEPQFGFSACAFWLTRFAIAAIDISAIKSYNTQCELVPAHTIQPNGYGLWDNLYGDPATACSMGPIPTAIYPRATPTSIYLACCTTPSPTVCSAGSFTGRSYTCDPGYTKVDVAVPDGVNGSCYRGDYYKKTETVFAFNEGRYADITPTPETAYCEIVAWEYEKVGGGKATVAANSCTDPKKYPSTDSDTIPLSNDVPADPEDSNDPFQSEAGGTVCSKPFEPVTLPGTPGTVVDWPTETVTIPSGSFLLQVGSIAPVYPTMYGALVYDLYLKKWGKYKGDYKALLDYQPLNDQSGGGIPYNRFGILGGVIKSNGLIYVFDDKPAASSITYGKIGYYRLGKTSVEECIVHFRTLSKGSMRVDTSMNGRGINPDLSRTVIYDNVLKAQLNGGFPGSWQNITINGIFDITYLEYRGFIQGKR